MNFEKICLSEGYLDIRRFDFGALQISLTVMPWPHRYPGSGAAHTQHFDGRWYCKLVSLSLRPWYKPPLRPSAPRSDRDAEGARRLTPCEPTVLTL